MYSALGAGLEGGVGALDSIAAGKAANAKEAKELATWKKKEDYKFNQDLAKIGVKSKLKAEVNSLKASGDTAKEWRTWTDGLGANQSAQWTPDERRDYGIADETSAIRTAALQFQKSMKLPTDWFNNNVASTNFSEGLTEWNEHNRRQVQNDRPPLKSPLTFIESRFAIQNSNIPAQMFLNEDGSTNREAIIESNKKVYNRVGQKGVNGKTLTQQDIWKKTAAMFNEKYKQGSSEREALEAEARNAEMPALIFWINTRAG